MISIFKVYSAFIILLLSTVLYSQKVSRFQINGELFKISGKWEAKGQLKESGQFQLINKKEKMSLLISVRKPEKFEFYNQELNERELLEKFYKWDYDYWGSSNGILSEVNEIKRNEQGKYIIWKLIIKNSPHNDNKDKTSYSLHAVRNNNLISMNLAEGFDKEEKLNESEFVELLEKTYSN